ncbi:hypothetical protein [Rubrivirga sp.]|uniref:hypothetical protein n=1 Tax=Rubrivirga sp. TaxID=1885344 RepID=UPI003C74AD79
MRGIALVFVLAGCSPPGDQGLADHIEAGVDTSAVIDLEALAPFEWDRLYVVPPYTTEETFERSGPEWPDRWEWSHTDLRDDRAFLIFALEDEVVSAFDSFMRDGNFVPHPYFQWRPGGVSPDSARFVVMGRDLVLEADLPDRLRE